MTTRAGTNYNPESNELLELVRKLSMDMSDVKGRLDTLEHKRSPSRPSSEPNLRNTPSMEPRFNRMKHDQEEPLAQPNQVLRNIENNVSRNQNRKLPSYSITLRSDFSYTYTKIDGKVCKIAIGGTTCFNFITSQAIERFSLPTKPISHPYTIKWDDETKTLVDHKCLVPIEFITYQQPVWCDVLPLQSNYHIHLSEAWLEEFDDSYVIRNHDPNIRIMRSKPKTLKAASLEPKQAIEPKSPPPSHSLSQLEPTLQVEPSSLPSILGPIPNPLDPSRLDPTPLDHIEHLGPNLPEPKEPMVTTLGNDEPQLDLDLPLGNRDLEDPPTQLELEPLSLPKEHLDLNLTLETQNLGLEDSSPIKPLEFNQPILGLPNPTIHLIRTIDPKPTGEPKPSEPLGSTQPSPEDTLDPSLGHNPLKDTTPKLEHPLPLGTETLEALPSHSLEVLPSQVYSVEPDPTALELAETELNMLYLPELEHFEFVIPERLTLNILHLLKLEPFEIDLDLKSQPLGESQGLEDLTQDPMMLESSLLNSITHTIKPSSGSTQLELSKRFENKTALPILQVEHIEFVIPSHLDILYPKYTNDCGREREFYVGIPDWKNMEHGHGLNRMLDTKRLRCYDADPTCDPDTDYTDDHWIPVTFDIEDPRLLKHHSFHDICMHNVEFILEDQTRLTLDEVQFSYLVKYVHGDKSWHLKEELPLAVPNLLTHYRGYSSEKNSFPPGEDDGGREHDPRRYKWSLRLP